MPQADQELDARGLNCPLPIIKTKKALKGMEVGEVIRIIATDPGAVKDFEAYVAQSGDELLEHSEDSGEFTFYLKKV